MSVGERLRAIGASSMETAQERLDREVLILGGLLMSGGGLVWGALSLAFGLWLPAAIPLGYVLITAANFGVLVVTRRFRAARLVQVALSLMLPFFFQWSLGGFVNSGSVMLWSMISLVGSLTFSRARETLGWLAIYCALVILTGVLDALFAQHAPLTVSPNVARFFFVLNAVMISSIVFGVAMLLTQRQRDAIGALERETARSRELATSLHVLKDSLEEQVRVRTSQLESARERAEAAVRAKSEFLATVSHELRTPLNGILATSELLQLGELSEEQTGSVRMLSRSGELLLTIINDLLDFSKIEAGKLELHRRAFDPRAEIEAMVGLHRASAEQKGIALELRCGELPASVDSDPDRLLQVLSNLLSNAVKFTERGSVQMQVSAVALEGRRAELAFTVRDTGIGMSEQTCGRLFQPFMQAESQHSRRFGGTGLGLSIASHLVKALGGSLTVASELDVGTTFELRVPVGVTSAACAKAARSELPSFGFKVLVTDDNAINVAIAKRMLDRVGCSVTVAQNGRDAVNAVAQADFDLVLMDVQMPVLDGIAATRLIRERDLTQPHIVALTANAFDADRSNCLAAGMNDFLAKPLRLKDLIECLQRVQRSSAPVALVG